MKITYLQKNLDKRLTNKNRSYQSQLLILQLLRII